MGKRPLQRRAICTLKLFIPFFLFHKNKKGDLINIKHTPNKKQLSIILSLPLAGVIPLLLGFPINISFLA
jgi:hypothetical protein